MLFVFGRESIRRAFRDEYELETNSIAFFQFHFIYIQKQNERERLVCEHAYGKEESLGMLASEEENDDEEEQKEARRHRA